MHFESGWRAAAVGALVGVYGLQASSAQTGVAVTGTFTMTVAAEGLEPGARDPDKDVDTLYDAGNTGPVGIWSDGTTMWVADHEDARLYAYTLSTGTRDAARDVDARETRWAAGIWSNGTTMWVADWTADEDAGLYAYTLSTGIRDAARDVDARAAEGNTDPYGIWSDGATMWVADFADARLYAYILSTRDRDTTRDFEALAAAGNDGPSGIWSDGTTMWVADDADDKLYAYHLGAWSDIGLTEDQYDRYRDTWTATTTPIATTTPASLTDGDSRMPRSATFTARRIGPGTTTVRAIHFQELRERIAALRARENLPAVRWTDPVLTPGAIPVRRVHLTELRAALDAVYDAVGSPRPNYTDPVVAAGETAIRAVHLLELRAAVAALD